MGIWAGLAVAGGQGHAKDVSPRVTRTPD
jgi:hypothetical protein